MTAAPARAQFAPIESAFPGETTPMRNRLAGKQISIGAILAFLLFVSARFVGAEPALRAVYLGQDGHDYCSPEGRLGPDDIQDLHLRIEGLKPGQRIVEASFQREGGGEWTYSARPEPTPHFRAEILREPGAPTADVYLEPSNDDLQFDLHIELREASGARDEVDVHCGRSDPNLFMPHAVLCARWVGQDGHDLTGRGPAVGPDGFQDARIDLEGLSKILELRAIHLDGGRVGHWECGPNADGSNGAELVWDANDASKGGLFFSPMGDLRGRKLMLTVSYMNGKSQRIPIQAGPTNASLPITPPVPTTLNDELSRSLSVRWIGQDDKPARNDQADIHVELHGLPPSAEILAAAISDPCGGYWMWCPKDCESSFYPASTSSADLRPLNPTDRNRFALMRFSRDLHADAAESLASIFETLPLKVQRHRERPTIDLFFPPFRDERDTRMMLRLLVSSGKGAPSTACCSFEGGACDPYLRGELPTATSIDAHPGDDLNALVTKAGHIRLSPGTYRMSSPLILDKPVAIIGGGDTTVEFSQTSSAPAWQDAIQLSASNITLEGFSIRFGTPVRWALKSFGESAVLRAVGGRHSASGEADPLVNLTVEKMDISLAPLAHVPEPGHEQPNADLIRFGQATSGRIIGNTLRGGCTDVMHGPWEITDNHYLGAIPGTMVWDAFAAHYAHDLIVARNHLAPLEPCGKTWRFFVLTQSGHHVQVTDNAVQNIGMKDTDRLENPNAPEIILTESYRVNFEGRPAGIGAEGRVLQIPLVLYGRVTPGSVVSILTGSHAGEYFRIAQPLSPTSFLLDQALPADLWKSNFAISIGQGIADGTWKRNFIDARDGGSSLFVLAGSHWNQQVSDNHLIGGKEAMRIGSEATECPGMWGWSRTPMFDLVLDHNLCEDSLCALRLNVSGDEHARTISGRTYLTALLRQNTIRWSPNFSRPFESKARKSPVAAPQPFLVGDRSGPDPVQMRVRIEGNTFDRSPASDSEPPMIVTHATIDAPH